MAQQRKACPQAVIAEDIASDMSLVAVNRHEHSASRPGPWGCYNIVMDSFMQRMAKLYADMQEAYDSVARHYGGFNCTGCTDNCCSQRFFHHALAEYRYLKEGVLDLLGKDPELLRRMLIKARAALETYAQEAASGERVPVMCPVNFDGLCMLYGHRPMICRMHGLPHRFRMPDGREERGSGCARFSSMHPTDWTVNRTGLYRELSGIEADLRRTMHFRGRYARTTAEMLMDMVEQEESLQRLLEG